MEPVEKMASVLMVSRLSTKRSILVAASTIRSSMGQRAHPRSVACWSHMPVASTSLGGELNSLLMVIIKEAPGVTLKL